MQSRNENIAAPETDGWNLSPRPAERVRSYLLSSYKESDRRAGMRLPSVRKVAKHLGVSPATVQQVYQRLAEEGVIRSEVGSGSFWTANQKSQTLQIGINIPAPMGTQGPTDWAYLIYGGIMHGILQSPRPIVLRPLPLAALESEEGGARFLEESRNVDGVILFPFQFIRRLRRLCLEEGRPAVYLNPASETATSNFVSPAYYTASRLLTRALAQAGRRKIALLVSPSLENSVSVRLRCAGAAAGLGEHLGRDVEMRIFEAESRELEAGRKGVRAIWAEGYRPDAICCAGDSLAGGALEMLLEMGISVPDEVSVVGGNGLGLQGGDGKNMTAMHHAMDTLGANLVTMLLQLIESKGSEQPGIFLPPLINIGTTTRPEENAILEESMPGTGR